jgi:hypothetical protein
MPASSALLSSLATHAASLITHVSLVNAGGTQIGDRQATAGSATGANVRVTDATFQIPGGSTVAGWRAHTAATGGTDLGGSSLTAETYAGAGTYTLTGSATGFNVSAS